MFLVRYELDFYIPYDDILRGHRRESLRSGILYSCASDIVSPSSVTISVAFLQTVHYVSIHSPISAQLEDK
jgi:hypothetical protein